MSEVVRYKGKIKKIDIGELTPKEYMISKLSESDLVKFREDDERWGVEEYELCYEYPSIADQYLYVNNSLFTVVEKEQKSDEYDIFDAVDNGDGTYDYHVMYYNGGCGFDEAVELALNKIKG